MHFPILEDYFQSLHFWQKTVIFHDKTALMLLLPINNKSRKISPHSQIHQTSHPNHKLPRANTTIFQNFFLNQEMLSAQLLLKKEKKRKETTMRIAFSWQNKKHDKRGRVCGLNKTTSKGRHPSLVRGAGCSWLRDRGKQKKRKCLCCEDSLQASNKLLNLQTGPSSP